MAMRTLAMMCGGALMLSCAGASEEPLGQRQDAVVGGVTNPASLGFTIDRFQRNAVVDQAVTNAGSTSHCTGILVGDRAVISAAACVVLNRDAWLAGEPAQAVTPADVSIAVGADASKPDCKLEVESIHVPTKAPGSSPSDIAIALLKSSAIDACPNAVPVQVNREALSDQLVDEWLLMGGYGATDFAASTLYSPVRNWSLLQVASIAPDHLSTRVAQHGMPSPGDEGAGLLRRFADGSLRAVGVYSQSKGSTSSFVRLDSRAAFIGATITQQAQCGTVGASGVCRANAVATCDDKGFASRDCAVEQRNCEVDAQGAAHCISAECSCDLTSACDPNCTCDTDCSCKTEPAKGCGVAGGGVGAGAMLGILVLAAVALARRGLRSRGALLAMAALSLTSLGCSKGTVLVCEAKDAGEVAADAGHADSKCQKTADVLTANACPAGQTCDLADPLEDRAACRAVGTTPAYENCGPTSLPCAAGTGCLGLVQAKLRCLPFCDERTGTCPGDGSCMVSAGATPVGICLPAEACDLVSSQGCAATLGCYLAPNGKTVCSNPGTVATGADCTLETQCGSGSTCHAGRCAPWCRVATDCTWPATCKGIGETPGHLDLGYCG